MFIPALTEERRRDLVKLVARKVEDAHVSVRNIRRDGIEQIRGMEKNKALSSDECRRAQDELQVLTDTHIGIMDSLHKDKESEVMEI